MSMPAARHAAEGLHMTVPTNNCAITLAQEMVSKNVPRHRFVAAIDASGEEMVRASRLQNLAPANVYRALREYRLAALEEFDRLACRPTAPASDS